MGRIKERRMGLRRRWLWNTAAVVASVGLVCALAVTVLFALTDYSNLHANLRLRAETAAEALNGVQNQEYEDFYQTCLDAVQSFSQRNTLEVQFVDPEGNVLSTSYGIPTTSALETPEIAEAVRTRGAQDYFGKDPETGKRILAVSAPIIYRNGEVIGVLRFVTATRRMEQHIGAVLAVSLLAVAGLTGATLLSNNYCIRSILLSVAEITQKARRIAGGTYGIQIEILSHDELGELAKAINDLSNQLSQNEKMQSEFISSLSHELRTPLTAITGWSETLLGGDTLDAETARGMRIILREARRLTEMVVDLLDFTRMQDGRMTLNVEPADIRSEFEDTVYMYSSRLVQEGIALELEENDQDIPEIPCDAKRLRQVFLNVLDNAAKHGGEGKRILASMHYDGSTVLFRIRDFGPGIPEDELSLVKKKFYRGSSKTRGTGIGLAVCEEIVTMHGGTLTLENAEGGGTLVTIALPAAQ